jgi:hypothetical protein
VKKKWQNWCHFFFTPSVFPFLSLRVVYFVQEHCRYLIDILVAINLSQLVLLSVVVEHLCGFIKEDDQASSQCFSCIIGALV